MSNNNKYLSLHLHKGLLYAIKQGTRVRISDRPAAVSCIIDSNISHWQYLELGRVRKTVTKSENLPNDMIITIFSLQVKADI